MTTTPSDDLIRRVLAKPATFACVGVSANPVRPSHYVARYLARRGYRVVAVNPAIAGRDLFGTAAVGTVAEAGAFDVLDVFRRPEAVPALVAEALAARPGMRAVWLQIGVVSPEAEAMCDAAGVPIVQDRCPKIEYQRLFGELRMGGFATGLISSRLPRDT
ncbi:CoA-binding protein [Jannaschia sp. Os4]|uniref:CoA-binding protein n=1 Tax=Jannaschia sp. Os4 TaxID=2807617 RepID=UPI00193AA289|nr:CoA-binding protein [Jannaschia sp. Os4]MBM2576988.1 CoA-binding protein [Jannaschia sp. Os4]